jgi:hypothetical protein
LVYAASFVLRFLSIPVSSSTVDLASVRLPLLLSPSVLLLIFSSFSGAAQGHATSFFFPLD